MFVNLAIDMVLVIACYQPCLNGTELHLSVNCIHYNHPIWLKGYILRKIVISKFMVNMEQVNPCQ